MKWFLIALIIFQINCLYSENNGILFDDFKYTSVAHPDSIIGYGSIFGYNPWETDTGIAIQRAWVRWNIGNPNFSEYGSLELTQDGFKLKFSKGYKKSGLEPCTHSLFNIRCGTFASRIKFGSINPKDKITDAYWLYSPLAFKFIKNYEIFQCTDEMDFEWNNWWKNASIHRISTGSNNRNYKFPYSMSLECAECKNGKFYPFGNCDSIIKGKRIIADQWATGVFVIDSAKNEVRIMLRVNNFDESGTQIYAGVYNKDENIIEPMTIKDVVPFQKMMVFYSIGIAEDVIDFDHEFNVDWFYYSSRTDLSIDDIEHNVDSLKKLNISRISTCNAIFREPDKYHNAKDLFINGPDTININEKNLWFLDTRYLKWSSYNAEFMYRFHNSTIGWEDFSSIYSNHISLTPENIHDSLQLIAYVKDEWIDYRDTLIKSVKILNSIIDTTSNIKVYEPIPNPFKAQTSVRFCIFKESDIKINVFTLNGMLIDSKNYGLLQQGIHTYEFKTEKLNYGVYFCQILCNGESYIKKLIYHLDY